jgi:hypothetical protein
METVHTVQHIPSNVPSVVTPTKTTKEIPDLKRKRLTSDANRPQAKARRKVLGLRYVLRCCAED